MWCVKVNYNKIIAEKIDEEEKASDNDDSDNEDKAKKGGFTLQKKGGKKNFL